MQDRLRTPLASVALVAALSVAGVASANGGGEPSQGHGKSKPCKVRGKGYEVKGLYVGGDLVQVAGTETVRWGDDRWTGTLVVEVTKGNRRGRRDVGLSSYAVNNVRVVGAKEGVIPDEGTRVQLVGKQNASCAPSPTTPTTPTTSTPEPTVTASKAEYSRDDEAEQATDDVPAEETTRVDDESVEKPYEKPGKSKPTPHHEDDDHGDHSYDDEDAYVDGAAGDSVDEPTPVTDVTIRVVEFNVRSGARR